MFTSKPLFLLVVSVNMWSITSRLHLLSLEELRDHFHSSWMRANSVSSAAALWAL